MTMPAAVYAVVPQPAVGAGPVHGRRVASSPPEHDDVSERAEHDDDAVCRVGHADASASHAERARGRGLRRTRGPDDERRTAARGAARAARRDEDQQREPSKLHRNDSLRFDTGAPHFTPGRSRLADWLALEHDATTTVSEASEASEARTRPTRPTWRERIWETSAKRSYL
jgi:hypothetical protein